MREYFSENAMPWLIGMTYKAIRTKRHKYIHWTQKSLNGVECDEPPRSQERSVRDEEPARPSAAPRPLIKRLRRQLAQLVATSVGL